MMFRYKNPINQNVYAACFRKGADDFMRRRGGSLQSAFMDGYKAADGCRPYGGIVRGSAAWAAMMAGKDRRRAEEQGKIKPAEVKDKRLLKAR